MIELPNSIQEAVINFSKIPGIGQKTALRQVLSLLKWNQETLSELALSLNNLSSIKTCSECGLYSDIDTCSICLDDKRSKHGILCVVENINDLMAIEKSNEFSGIYHVLGGVLNPLMGVGPSELKIEHLLSRVKKHDIQTIILAINPSVEGDATCSYINQLLENVNVERIGFGIPMGGSLEYLDPMTISKALENRKRI